MPPIADCRVRTTRSISRVVGLLLSVVAFAGCGAREPVTVASIPDLPKATASGAVVRYGYEVVRTWPHDPNAFTQGLVFRDGKLLESTGLVGRSSVREVEITTGRVLRQVEVPAPYFGEGLAVVGAHAYLLTWQHQKGFVLDVGTFRVEREFAYAGEGWGFATDGRELILSDGTQRIRFLNPESFAVMRTIEVTFAGKPVSQLNELEFIRGEIFANVWQTDQVVRIDPVTGKVRGIIDFAGLLAPQDRRPETDVLNGIAYDVAGDRLFITGKCWPKLFEVRLKPQP